MKKIILIPFILLFISLSAQTFINNKGNRNQSYPVITETKPEILNLINQASQDSIENYIRFLQGFIRDATSAEAVIIQNWLVEKFESYGYEDISIHYFDYHSQQLDAGNVVVVKKGTEFPDEFIIISTNYDQPRGPGADSNGSGTAAVVECARLFKDFPTKRSIIFVPFNAEELGLVGSMPFAQKCASENMNIIALFYMATIGWFPPDTETFMGSGYSYISKALFESYQQTANIYVPSIPTHRFSIGDVWAGDNMPFNMNEYPSLCVCNLEYINQHPCYSHGGVDTLGHCVNRLDLVKAYVKAVSAFAAELANAWLPPQNLSACSGKDKITVSWDGDNETSLYKVFKNSELLDETSKTFYEDYDVGIGNKYEYYVIANNNETSQETAPSNKDVIIFVEPLQLPYTNSFSDNKYGFEQSDWVLRNISGISSLCNTTGNGIFQDNYLSIAELDWLEIPKGTENISIRFKWRGNILGIGQYWNINNAGMWFEVTNDRKTWQKLAFISGNNNNWSDYEFSLNEFINSDFFQARFRLESSGAMTYSYRKIGYITDVEINYLLSINEPKERSSYISSFIFSPNPTSEIINIITKQPEPYHISIYDMSGRVVFSQDGFRDGTLSVANLKVGNYLVVASTKQHRMARKLIKK
jgi:hypothetical protein